MNNLAAQLLDRTDQLAARLYPADLPVHNLGIGGYRPPGGPWAPRPAAVLIAILAGEEPGIMLTVRSSHMALHAGQVALPGGGHEAQEAFPLDTALRETTEETGLDCSAVEVVGLLDRYDTISGYRIVPVVGVVSGNPHLRPCVGEVETIFTVPLATVLDPSSYRRHQLMQGDEQYELLSMAHPRWMIWGATAAILQDFSRRAAGLV